eukprot:TRINITY_DN33135_c0_g1_i1.p1 TRINITY_DN33135_c0_g1~~TRINITY_DN33135_c0_g1_i1.p1  ORF type:complete len:422 (+),score=68.70 TRINITY_DN33135_c0_g1_i1:42-1307(+)
MDSLEVVVILLAAALAAVLLVLTLTCVHYRSTKSKLREAERGDTVVGAEPIQSITYRGDIEASVRMDYTDHIQQLQTANARLASEKAVVDGELQTLRRELGDCQGVIAGLEGKCAAFHRAAQSTRMATNTGHDYTLSPEGRTQAEEIMKERLQHLTSKVDELTATLQDQNEELSVSKRLCRSLEKENAKLRNDLIDMKARHEEELTRLMFDLKEIQVEMGNHNTDEDRMRTLQAEAVVLRAELAKEKDESQLLFTEVERLRAWHVEGNHVREKNERLETELKTRPVILSPLLPPAAPPASETPPQAHVDAVYLYSAERPHSPVAYDDSPIMSPGAAARLKRLSSPVSKTGTGARIPAASPVTSAYKQRVMSDVDACLGLAQASDNPFTLETMTPTKSSGARGWQSPSRPQKLLRNPLDTWG